MLNSTQSKKRVVHTLWMYDWRCFSWEFVFSTKTTFIAIITQGEADPPAEPRLRGPGRGSGVWNHNFGAHTPSKTEDRSEESRKKQNTGWSLTIRDDGLSTDTTWIQAFIDGRYAQKRRSRQRILSNKNEKNPKKWKNNKTKNKVWKETILETKKFRENCRKVSLCRSQGHQQIAYVENLYSNRHRQRCKTHSTRHSKESPARNAVPMRSVFSCVDPNSDQVQVYLNCNYDMSPLTEFEQRQARIATTFNSRIYLRRMARRWWPIWEVPKENFMFLFAIAVQCFLN